MHFSASPPPSSATVLILGSDPCQDYIQQLWKLSWYIDIIFSINEYSLRRPITEMLFEAVKPNNQFVGEGS